MLFRRLSGSPGLAWLASSLKKLNLILSLRGMLLLLFALYLIAGPVMLEADIVATVVACALIGWLASIALLTTISGILLKRAVNVTICPPAAGADCCAHHSRSYSAPVRTAIKGRIRA
jgi:uncharacterized membrane protein